MVEWFTPAFSGGNGDVQVLLDFVLPDKIGERPRSQVDIERLVFAAGFTGNDAGYFVYPLCVTV